MATTDIDPKYFKKADVIITDGKARFVDMFRAMKPFEVDGAETTKLQDADMPMKLEILQVYLTLYPYLDWSDRTFVLHNYMNVPLPPSGVLQCLAEGEMTVKGVGEYLRAKIIVYNERQKKIARKPGVDAFIALAIEMEKRMEISSNLI